MKNKVDDKINLYIYDKGIKDTPLCGIDEAGRGPLAGPVVAAAVILSHKEEDIIKGLNDSKKLSKEKREKLYEEITKKAISYSVGIATVEEIEEINILKATFLAMNRAVDNLKIKPKLCLVDGNKDPYLKYKTQCVIKGDANSASIAAASIIAKVTRDRMMIKLDEIYPDYGFAKHKGYGTKLHYENIIKHGMLEIHRRSFLKNLNNKKETKSNINGRLGEKLAYGYLIKNKYEILDRNYISEYGEIDIIAKQGDIIAFVEVKYRGQNAFYEPQQAVTKPKMKKIIKTAITYISKNNIRIQPRFDIIEIKDIGNKKVMVNMIENAFIPEEEYGFI